MSGQRVLEVERVDDRQRVDPRPDGRRQPARKPLHLQDVGAEDRALVGEVQHGAVVRMRGAEVGHRHPLSAERDRVLVGVGRRREVDVADGAASDFGAADDLVAVVVEEREALGDAAGRFGALDEAVAIGIHLHRVRRQRRIAGRRRQRREHVAMADELRRVGPDDAARGVIPVAGACRGRSGQAP